MAVESKHVNGWAEYKNAVMQQLTYVAGEVKEIREALAAMDKGVSLAVASNQAARTLAETQSIELTRRIFELGEAQKLARDDRSRFVNSDAYGAACADTARWRAEHAAEYAAWKMTVTTQLAVSEAQAAQVRKSWTIVTVVVSLAINAVALILAFMIHASGRP